MSHVRAFGKFLQAIFWHGGRRWLCTTGPSIIVAVATLINLYLEPLPQNMLAAFIWTPKWWTWGLAILSGVLLATYLAWREQYLTTLELNGRPNVILLFRDDNLQASLRLSGQIPAIDISAKEIVLPVPKSIAVEITGTHFTVLEKSGEEYTGVLTECLISFGVVGALMPEGIDNLPFTIRGVPSTVTSPRSLFRLIAPDYDLEFPFVLCFSNLGPPKRTWHSHYNVKYRPVSQSIVTAHLHMGETGKDGLCSHCSSEK